jgi:hypothetical protein
MIRTQRASTTAVVIVCLLAAPSSELMFASDDASLPRTGSPSLLADSAATGKEDVSTIRVMALASTEQLPGTTEFVRSVMEPSPLTLDTRLIVRSLAVAPDASVFAQRGYRGRGSRGRNNGAAAAMFLGAAAAIAGTALLVYANRPECRTTLAAGGCGYGTKVVGGAVLSAGIVGVLVGAATWR